MVQKSLKSTEIWNGHWCKEKIYRSRQELSDEYLLAKFGFDTAENEPPKGSKKCMLQRTPLARARRSAGSPRGLPLGGREREVEGAGGGVRGRRGRGPALHACSRNRAFP